MIWDVTYNRQNLKEMRLRQDSGRRMEIERWWWDTIGLLQLGNHDQHRVASRFDPELVDGLNFIGQLLPGVSVTYNGEEIGMENTYITWEQCVDPQGLNAGPEGYLEATRDLERTPFQWDNTTSAGTRVHQSVFESFIAKAHLSKTCSVFCVIIL